MSRGRAAGAPGFRPHMGWHQAVNPGGLEAEPPSQKRSFPWSRRTPVVTERPWFLVFLGQWWGKCGRLKARHLVRPEADGNAAIEELVGSDRAASQRVAPTRLLDLQNTVVQRD